MWNQVESITRMAIKLGMALTGCTVAWAAHAQTGCTYTTENPYGAGPFNAVVPLNITDLTIGRDVSNGTVLYRQTIRGRDRYVVNCSSAIPTIEHRRTLPVTPRPLSSWNSNPYAGKVYETGVPGIGVAIWWAGNAYPYTNVFANSGLTWIVPSDFDISLIKIGAVSPGTISGANLPTAQQDYVGNGIALRLARISFSGSIRIVSQTCRTPNVTVPLGDYKVGDFRGSGTGTPYKDFFIELQNCPAFYGASASLINTDSPGSPTDWVESSRRINPNVLSFSLTPVNGVVASQRGTVQLSPGTPGAPSATGIGVQLIRALGGFLQFDTLLVSGITPTNTTGASYSIPMSARYVQTGAATPTPGPANASVMFTINYQ
jgi:type 1 fimbria pilin